ncbi:DUF4157 domain-containing protein [Halovivax limisalsi]|uniref:eCIS core domain-containing protein n=1 Tax=Halovivax limisalsi TaxID=1453760 RepID=UPI001FFC95C2|nr:DUF4157 domain-containing protein [Halovivax limisalsi]
MAFQSARANADDSASERSSPAGQSPTTKSDSGGAAGVAATPATEFGLGYADEVDASLQRLAKTHGSAQVHSWIDEGVPVETMGTTRSMEAFRERQAERPPEVPTDIEQQNEASLHRSKKAQYDTGAAGDAGVPSSVRDVVSSPGTGLDGDVKAGLEDRLGQSLDHVQVHTGPKAQEACQEVNARAFAVGNHIAFGPGEYDPGSPEGQHLIAHEVVHTLQQPDAAISMMPKTQVEMEVDPDPAAEREADDVASQVMQGGDLGVGSMRRTDVHVQRVVSSAGAALSAMTDMVKLNRDIEQTEKEIEAQEYAGMGATDGSLSERVAALEENVQKLGQYVSEQVEPQNAAGPVANIASREGVSKTAGIAAGGGLMAMGLGGPLAAIAAGMFAKGGTEALWQYGSAMGKTADQLSGGKLSEWGKTMKSHLPKSLGGSQDGDDFGGNDINGIR